MKKKRSKILGVSKCISQKAVILPKLISIEENDSLSAHVAGKHTKSGARPSSPIRLAGTLYWHTGLLIRIRVRPSANSPAATQSKVEMRKWLIRLSAVCSAHMRIAPTVHDVTGIHICTKVRALFRLVGRARRASRWRVSTHKLMCVRLRPRALNAFCIKWLQPKGDYMLSAYWVIGSFLSRSFVRVSKIWPRGVFGMQGGYIKTIIWRWQLSMRTRFWLSERERERTNRHGTYN